MAKTKKSFLQDWTDVGGPNSGIVRDSKTGREGERSIVTLDPIYDPKNEEFIYNYRRETKAPLVSAYGSELLIPEKVPKGEKKTKADPYNHLLAVTERIPHRLADAPQLTYPESLYTLDRSLEGYETAYDKCGPFRVNDRMIGFNPEGRCKVWVNENFANNHPSHPRRVLQSTLEDSKEFLEGRHRGGYPVGTDESDMVQDVVDVVESHCEEGRFPEPFATQIRQKNLTFAEARRLIHEASLNSKYPIPDRVDLFRNMVTRYRTTTNTHTYVPPKVATTTTTTVVQPDIIRGYRFNYIPPTQPYHPDIFASRVGEHGVHQGVRY